MDLFTAAKSVNIIDVYNFYSGKTGKMRKGRKSTAVTCPFHDDKRPSLNLFPNNTFYCFSCRESGTNIDFVMKMLDVDNITAAKRICTDFGIEYEEASHHNNKRKVDDKGYSKGLLETNKLLANYFHAWLTKAPNPNYFKDRGLGALVDSYELGYCPKGKVFNKPEVAQRYGLGNDKGECVFAGRYMVPIKNIHGIVIGFIGRLPDAEVDDSHPKYLNSCNSEVFRKREVFFNAPALLEKGDSILVVEGVFDALSYIAAGITNVVSPLGCSLHDKHIEILSKFTGKTVLAFDQDEAGRAATEKAIGYAGDKLRLGILVSDYDSCTDVNELLVKKGIEAVRQAIQYLPAPLYLIQEYEKSGALNSIDGQERLWKAFAKMLGYEPKADIYPLSAAYTPVTYEYYWGLFKKARDAHALP